MSVARGLGQNGGHFYSNISKPVKIDLNFVVDSTNGNALGIRSLKSNGYVEHVFMNTSPAATTATAVFASGVSQIQVSSLLNLVPGMVITDSTTSGNITDGTTIQSIYAPTNTIFLSAPTAGASASAPGDTLSFAATAALVGNPNPLAGYALIVFKNNFNCYLGGFSGFASPVSGTPIAVTTGTTAGHPYIITVLGNTSLAQWQKLGVPAGLTPSVGMSFVAIATTTATGTGYIEAPAADGAGIAVVDVIGDPNQSLNNSNVAANAGAQVLVRFATSASSGAAAPAAGSVVGMSFFFDGSSVTIDGL